MRFNSGDIPAIFADGRTIVELKTITGAFDPFASPPELTAICALETFERGLESTLSGHSECNLCASAQTSGVQDISACGFNAFSMNVMFE